jgi:hypothetical protein
VIPPDRLLTLAALTLVLLVIPGPVLLVIGRAVALGPRAGLGTEVDLCLSGEFAFTEVGEAHRVMRGNRHSDGERGRAGQRPRRGPHRPPE